MLRTSAALSRASTCTGAEASVASAAVEESGEEEAEQAAEVVK